MLDNKIALLIDIENISPEAIRYIIDDLSLRGTLTIKKLYCVADKLTQKSIIEVVTENNLDIKTQYNVVSGKNVSDFKLVIDAMDILYNKDVDCFAIVSSDSDFTILINKIREENKTVIGYGEVKTNPQYRSACNEFVFVENLYAPLNKTEFKETKVKSVSEIENELISVINSSEDDTVVLSQLNDYLKAKYSDFDVRTYGKKKFSDFMKLMKKIELIPLADKTTIVARIKETKKEEVIISKSPEYELIEIITELLKSNNNSMLLSDLGNNIKKKMPDFTLKKYKVSRFYKLIEKLNCKKFKFDDDKKPMRLYLKNE